MELDLFIGRFHPLIVHLPIGFLLLAAIMEVLPILFKGKFNNLNAAIAIALLLGGFGAVGSAIAGYLLAGAGGYDDSTLGWHKWMGIGLAVLSFIGWFTKAEFVKVSKSLQRTVIFGLVIIVSITGHLGGNLTHGSDYLVAYAPEFVKKMTGAEINVADKKDLPRQSDSIVIFQHLVQPILEEKCASCHNPSKTQGGLLITVEGLREGGNSGAAFHAGKPMDSELFVRTTLPQSSKKFMPPKGEPLSYTELKLIEWWISEGASFDASLGEIPPNKKIQALLLRDYEVDTSPRPYYELVQVDPVSEADKKDLAMAGWSIAPLAADHPMLEATFKGDTLTAKHLAALAKAAANITWLDMSDLIIEPGALASLSVFTNLTRLELNGSTIGDNDLTNLSQLAHLEMLNVYDTPVSDESIELIAAIKSLKKVYVWNSNLTLSGMSQLKDYLPNTEVISGVDG